MNFSVPRCRSPICGSTRSTTSPSSSSTRRSTPCAAGCCGPKLIVKLRMLCSVICRIPANGEWRVANVRQSLVGLPTPLLQRPDQGPEPPAESSAGLQQGRTIRAWHQSDPLGQIKMGFRFLERALSHAKEMNEGWSALATMSFCDIGGDGAGGATNLRGQAKHFLPRKCPCHRVTC